MKYFPFLQLNLAKSRGRASTNQTFFAGEVYTLTRLVGLVALFKVALWVDSGLHRNHKLVGAAV